tara:strand:+ start:19711 stop:21387 length:1677 start_codon:yes stop_codon:yes gene_type:complete
MRNFSSLLLFVVIFSTYNINAQPTLLDDNLSIKKLTTSPSNSVRISFNQADGNIYLVTQGGDLYEVNIETGNKTLVQTSSDLGIGDVQGMDISKDGVIYLVGNSKVNSLNTVTIKRGLKTEGVWNWETVAQTEPYPLSNTAFDHIMNNVTISPDNQSLILNSGSRTDHGEIHDVDGRFPGLREAALTAKILKIPANSSNLILEDDLEFLKTNGYIFAEGTRNSFSLAYDSEGNLFGTENAGDRDDPEELNWIREGHHYGFPWVIGGNDTPMQFSGYDPDSDPFIPPNSTASNLGTFYDDPDYPAPPEGVSFTYGVVNNGPDADTFRDLEDGIIKDASELGRSITTFSSHLSPLGLVFDTTNSMGGNFENDGFMLGFTGGNDGSFFLSRMNYGGEDLLHLEFTKVEDNFEITTTRLIKDFLNPIDSEIIGNKIYVLEFKTSWLNNNKSTGIWEVTFPANTTNTENLSDVASKYKLYQNYPNPFNPSTTISFDLFTSGFVELEVSDALGRKVATLVNREMNAHNNNSVSFDASDLTSGIYFYTLRVDGAFVNTQKMMLIK